MKAREWLVHGASASDPFERFSSYWRGFNNLFAGKGRERELIARFIELRVTEEFARSLIRKHPQEANFLVSQPVVDMRLNGKDTAQYIEQFNKAATAKDQLTALFMTIYQVRCNLEHGQKSPKQARDATLCEASAPFVAGIVDHAA